MTLSKLCVGNGPKVGEVWTFLAPATDEFLVAAILDVGELDLLVVPLLAEALWAADADICLSEEFLGYAALALVWASDYVLTEQAVEVVTVLSEECISRLIVGYDAFFSGDHVVDSAGPAVLGNRDPRIAAHAALADDLRAFYLPWSSINF